MNNVQLLKQRTQKYALNVIFLFKKLPYSEEARIIGKQLLRSASSVGANYRAACRARSDAEFYSKICIVVEEIDESEYWLELIEMAKILPVSEIADLLDETRQLIKIFATIKSKSRK